MITTFDNAHLWSPEYSRNNKQFNLKNLRCFPLCSEGGHMEQGFCGRPILFTLSRTSADEEMFAWGEFKRADFSPALVENGEEPAPALRIELGSTMSRRELMQHTKDPKSTKAESLEKPLFEGILPKDLTGTSTVNRTARDLCFVFNKQKKGWNYPWQSNKYTALSQHAFFVYLFVPAEGDLLTCVGVHASPKFSVLCRKKSAVSSSRTSAAVSTSSSTPSTPQLLDLNFGNAPFVFEEEEDAFLAAKRVQLADDDARRPEPILTHSELQADPVTAEEEEEEELPESFEESLLDPLLDPYIEHRMELILPALYGQFNKESDGDGGNLLESDFFAAAHFTTDDDDWFHAAAPATPNSAATTMAAAAEDSSSRGTLLLAQLAMYLVEERTLSASVREIVASNYGRARRRRAVLNSFHREITAFLQVYGYSELDLDQALGRATTPSNKKKLTVASSAAEEDKHVDELVAHLTKVAIQQQIAATVTSSAAVDRAANAMRPDVDLSGHWRLDDTLIQALDECRQRRGVPAMVRQMVSRTEREIVLMHSTERILMGIMQNKLFSSTSEEFILDGRERPLDRVLPIPWSNNNEALTEETAQAWMDKTTAKQFRTYGGVLRTYMAMRRSGPDRIEMDVHFLERREGSWKCIFAKRGYAERISDRDPLLSGLS